MKAELRSDRTFLTSYYPFGFLGLAPLLGLLEFLQKPKTLTSFPALLCMAICGCVITFFSLRWFQRDAKFASFASKGTQREEVVMSVAFKEIDEVAEQISQIEGKNQATCEHLEQIYRLEKNIRDDVTSAAIADEITQIQLIVHDANELTKSKKFYLLLEKVDQATCNIKSFHEKHQKPLPEGIFKDLCSNLETHKRSINAIERSLVKLQKWTKSPQKSYAIEDFLSGLESLSTSSEGNLEFFSYHLLDGLQICLKKMADPKYQGNSESGGKPFISISKKHKERFNSIVSKLVEQLEQAKAYILSTQSAEVKAIERIHSTDKLPKYITVAEAGGTIDLTKLNERLKKRGYNIQIPCEDSPTS